jgi:hypothetical protein
MRKINIMMIVPRPFFATAAVTVLVFSMTGISYQQGRFLDDEEGIYYNTDDTPYRKRLSDGDII